MRAGEDFAEGKSRAEVAKKLGVSWRAAHNWYLRWKQGGMEALKAQGKPGPVDKISDAQLKELEPLLALGPLAHGYPNDLWTLKRVAQLVEENFEQKLSQSETWRLLRRMGWSSQKPKPKARERDEQKIAEWKEKKWPQIKQKAAEEARTIVFVDESGLTQKPATKKTWAPEAQTPQLEMNFNWKTLSVIGGISLMSLYFQIHNESIKSKQVIEFLDPRSGQAVTSCGRFFGIPEKPPSS